MADNSNYLSTPSNYATPEQLKSTQDYAKALLYGNMQQPVHHWTQGVSNMVSALVGGNLDWGAAQKEKQAQATRGAQDMPPNPYPTAAPPKSFSEGPSAAGQTNAAGGDPIAKAAAITSSQESGGDYHSVGPQTRTGDRAYGKYQVMGANIPSWTQEALGQPISTEEFLNNPVAQEAVYKKKMGEYIQKYGLDAGKAWFAGEQGMNNPNATAHTPGGTSYGPTVSQYGGKFAQAFAGTPSDTTAQAPAAQAIAAATKGAPPAASGAPTNAAPMPTQQHGMYFDPSSVPNIPQYSREQVQGLLSNPWATNEQKERIRNEYIRQNQPIEMAYPGGKVLIDPRDHTHQQFIPDAHWGESQIGDIHRPIMLTPNGQGGLIQAPVIHPQAPVGPQSQAAPAAAPTGSPAVAPGATQAMAQSAPAAPAQAAKAPVQVASLDQNIGGGGSEPLPKPILPTAAPTTPASPFERFAQNSAVPPGIDPEDWAAYTQKKTFDTKQNVNEDSQKKAADFAAKKYDTLSTQAQAARTQAPNLDLALAMMNDPNIHQGLLHGVQDTWSRFKAAALGDKYANAPNETFDKLMSGAILGNMKTALGGLGQVRLAEINLLTKANANRNNTDASNRAVLEVSRRSINTLDHLDQIGQQYASGDEVADPITGDILLKPNVGPDGEVTPRHGLDAGYDKLARKYVTEHPSFTPEEVKHYQSIFDTGRNPDEVQQPNEGGKTEQGAVSLPPEVMQQLKAGQTTHFQNGQSWTIGPDGKPKQVK